MRTSPEYDNLAICIKSSSFGTNIEEEEVVDDDDDDAVVLFAAAAVDACMQAAIDKARFKFTR
jgi:hypothetical protein